MHTQLITHAQIATMTADAPYGLIADGAMALEGDKIIWVGAGDAIPAAYASWPQTSVEGRLITPALIDCHTHLIHAGNRATEFEMRLHGASYADIAAAGGGILSTVHATRAASEAELIASALPRIRALEAEGVATIEIKSGYGLTIEDELKMLRAARALEGISAIRIRTSFLAAHAIPPEYKNRADDYIDEVCIPALLQARQENLVDAVDGFCEHIAFSPAQITRLFETAQAIGLPLKLHAEQLSNQHGSTLAASLGALSADHLEYADDAAIAAMAAAGTVAVLLPAAFYYLREQQLPPIPAMRKAGIKMALATDCNPGTSPITSPLLVMNMGCVLFGLTPEESLAGFTRNAAHALGLQDYLGSIEAGKQAELAVWNVAHPCELAYRIGHNPLHHRIIGAAAA